MFIHLWDQIYHCFLLNAGKSTLKNKTKASAPTCPICYCLSPTCLKFLCVVSTFRCPTSPASLLRFVAMLERLSRRSRSMLSLTLTSLALALSILALCTSYWCEGTHKVVKPLCLSPVKMKNCGQNNSEPYTTGNRCYTCCFIVLLNVMCAAALIDILGMQAVFNRCSSKKKLCDIYIICFNTKTMETDVITVPLTLHESFNSFSSPYNTSHLCLNV